MASTELHASNSSSSVVSRKSFVTAFSTVCRSRCRNRVASLDTDLSSPAVVFVMKFVEVFPLSESTRDRQRSATSLIFTGVTTPCVARSSDDAKREIGRTGVFPNWENQSTCSPVSETRRALLQTLQASSWRTRWAQPTRQSFGIGRAKSRRHWP